MAIDVGGRCADRGLPLCLVSLLFPPTEATGRLKPRRQIDRSDRRMQAKLRSQQNDPNSQGAKNPRALWRISFPVKS
jgi:hypothetical protein